MFATDCMRGFHTAFAGFKRWMQKRGMSHEDEQLMQKMDVAAQAAKEWLRKRFIEGGHAARREWPSNEP